MSKTDGRKAPVLPFPEPQPEVRGTGTYGAAPRPAVGAKGSEKIPFNVAFREAVIMVNRGGPRGTGEQPPAVVPFHPDESYQLRTTAGPQFVEAETYGEYIVHPDIDSPETFGVSHRRMGLYALKHLTLHYARQAAIEFDDELPTFGRLGRRYGSQWIRAQSAARKLLRKEAKL